MLERKLFPLILFLVIYSASIVNCQGTPDLCYLKGGKVALTKEVVPPIDVTCPGGTILGGVPDLQVDNTKFSQIDFTKSNLSPGGFALDKFKFPEKADLAKLTTAGKLYTAANAALRVRGDKKIISKLKVVDFFIASQIEATKGKASKNQQIRLLNKVIKNCVGRSCTDTERGTLSKLLEAAQNL